MQGLMFAFQKVNPKADWLQRFVAMATRGKFFHVEVGFVTVDTSTQYFTYNEPVNYTAFVQHGFIQISNHRMNNEEWDFVFVPLPMEWQWINGRQWLQSQRGLPYDYWDALLSPFMPVMASTRKDDPSSIHQVMKDKLYCSEAMVLLLQYLQVNPNVFSNVRAKYATPTDVHKLLVLAGYPQFKTQILFNVKQK